MKSLIIAAIMGFAGTALIAEQTVPGNFLYPIKLSFNENVRHIIAVGPRAEARLALALLKERLSEAEQLADEGNLTPEVAAGVATAIANQAAKTSSATESTHEKDSVAVRAELSKTLETFRTSLEAYKDTELASSTEKLRDSVDKIVTSKSELEKEISSLKLTLEEHLVRVDKALLEVDVSMENTEELAALRYAREEVADTLTLTKASVHRLQGVKEIIENTYANFLLLRERKKEEMATSTESLPEEVTPVATSEEDISAENTTSE